MMSGAYIYLRRRNSGVAPLATRRFRLLILFIPAYLAQACIPIPTGEDKVLFGRQVADEQLAFIQRGVTTKGEIIDGLGQPDVFWEDERIFAYDWHMRWGVGIPLCGGPIPASCGPNLDIPKYYRLLIRFDPSDRVERYEVTVPSAFDSYGKQMEEWLGKERKPP